MIYNGVRNLGARSLTLSAQFIGQKFVIIYFPSYNQGIDFERRLKRALSSFTINNSVKIFIYYLFFSCEVFIEIF